MCFCSEAGGEDGSTVAYYQSEFDVHVSQQASLNEAMESLEQAGGQQGRQGRLLLRPRDPLSVSSVISRGQTAGLFFKVQR